MKHARVLRALLLPLLLCAAAARSGITIDAHDVDISDVISLLAAESGINVVTDRSVKPERITVHLHDVSFDDALRAITLAHGLTVRRDGSILIVESGQPVSRGTATAVFALHHAEPEEAARELTAVLPQGTVVVPDKRTGTLFVSADESVTRRARALVGALDSPHLSDASGTQTTTYPLRYLKPDDAVAKLKVLLSDGNILAELEQNAVLVSGGERVQRIAHELLAQIDVASPQVMFEVKVADVTPVNDSSNVGFEFGGLDLTGQPLPGAATYAFTTGTIPVNARLNLLVSKGNASILATPKLVTINNKEANLMIGETYPIVYSTSVLGGQNVQYVDIGVHLRVTPTIGSDGSVTAELHPEYSELVGYTSTGYPIVANRKIDSTLRVADNQTIVLGGLMRDTSSETIDKVPGLADIPIIGGLFKNKQTNHERDEIVFLITPHVIYPGSQPPSK
ncbi:MAG TPA: secretin N-terminal domain-containing protein [Candidatus Baltobacteraceae bacterium]|nr:secretin N-terminal domain-containing protein [Candidatus Baltobacteraceae bacterium]